ncbi:hypothetical protein [Streptomyces sp. NPDC048385]|uniref:hypothetical protein n=1 Tax=Streptomyces sp. NPDC048385 TaxID=3155145 RepID=UPI00341287A8
MPSHHLPLLLTAFQHRFRRDLEAMSRHLVDDASVGWEELGTDLLNGAPYAIVSILTGGQKWPSRTLDHLTTADGAPPVRMTVTDATADEQDMQWGYVLYPEGIEVISFLHEDIGPTVDWDTDPLTGFSDNPALWAANAPAPVVRHPYVTVPRTTPAPLPAKRSPARPAARR